MTIEALGWVSGACILAVWLGYPAAVALLARTRRPLRHRAPEPDPAVTVVIATHGDSEAVSDRVADVLTTAYGGEVDVVVAVDPSRPGGEFRRGFLPEGVTVVRGDDPGGKAATLNAGVRAARGEVVVFADTHQTFDRDAITALVTALGDPAVGVATGRLDLPSQSTASDWYWRLERRLRYNEGRLHSPVGATGAVYAIRKSLWQAVPPALIVDDLSVPMRLELDGYRVAFVWDAVALETRSPSMSQEYRRKVRTLTGVLQLCAWMPRVLNPLRNPVWVQFVTHKLLRFLTPYWCVLFLTAVARAVLRGTMPGTLGAVALAAAVSVWLGFGRSRVARFARGNVAHGVLLQFAIIAATVNAVRRRWDVWVREADLNGGARPVRVALVAPSLDMVGGQSVQASRLLARLRESDGIEPFLVPINPRLPGVLRLLQRVKYLRTLVTFPTYVLSLLMRLPRADVVHVFSASYWSFVLATAPAILVARLYGRRVVLNYRSGEADDHLRRWSRTVLPILRLVDRIVVPSGYLVEVFGRFGLRADVIANIVDLDRLRFRRRTPLRPVFLSSRNLEPLYNVACVLRAFGRIQAQRPDARLVVAGDGSERERLESLTAELGLTSVDFLGRVRPETLGQLYDDADVYLNGSNIDNMPGSIIEAFAAGLPVVTTDAGGIPYVVTDGETGLLVNREDDAALAAAALRLLQDQTLAGVMADRAWRECQTRYCWSAVGEAWLRLYRSLAGTCARPAAASAGGAEA